MKDYLMINHVRLRTLLLLCDGISQSRDKCIGDVDAKNADKVR